MKGKRKFDRVVELTHRQMKHIVYVASIAKSRKCWVGATIYCLLREISLVKGRMVNR